MAPNDPKKPGPAGAAGKPASPPLSAPADEPATEDIDAVLNKLLETFLRDNPPGTKDFKEKLTQFLVNNLGSVRVANASVEAKIQAFTAFLAAYPEVVKKLGDQYAELSKTLTHEKNKLVIDAINKLREEYMKTYVDIINRGINGKISPHEAKIEVARMGIMFGSLLQGIGVLFDKPELVAMGKGFVDRNTQEAEIEADKILALEKEAGRIKNLGPEKFMAHVNNIRTDVSPEMIQMGLNGRGLFDPNAVAEILSKVDAIVRGQIAKQNAPHVPKLGLQAGDETSTNGSTPVADITDPDQRKMTVWMAMLKSESNFDYVTYKTGGYSESQLSNFRLKRSDRNAMGIGQMIPSTAESAANGLNLPYDVKRYTQDTSYQLALSYKEFSRLWEKFGENVSMVLAGYNAGEGAVLDYANGSNESRQTNGKPANPKHRKIGNPMKGEVTDEEFGKKFPYSETREYIDRIKKDMPSFHARASAAKLFAAADGPANTAVAALNNPAASTTAEVYGDLMKRLGVNDPKVTPPFTAVAGLTSAQPTKPDTRAPSVKLPEFNYDMG